MLAGNEVTSARDIIDRIGTVTARAPVQVPIPSFLAALATRLASFLGRFPRAFSWRSGVPLPLAEATLEMLLEENVIRAPETNALTGRFAIAPTALDEGLRRLADELPEMLSADGVGGMDRKRFWADIEVPALTSTDLMALFKERVNDVMPMEFAAEPDVPTRIEQGATLTANIPMRGNIQVRVEQCTEDTVTLATVEGHPLAGIVTFRAEPSPGFVRFVVEIHARASNVFDRMAMRTVGRVMQNGNWSQVVERMVDASGGRARGGVESESRTLDEHEAEAVERWIDELIVVRKREAHRGTG